METNKQISGLTHKEIFHTNVCSGLYKLVNPITRNAVSPNNAY